MAKMADRNLLTIGALFVIIVVSVLLYVPAGLLTAWWMVLATMIVLFGGWLMALAVMQRSNPEKYGRGAFSYFGWGLLLIAMGGAWFLYYLLQLGLQLSCDSACARRLGDSCCFPKKVDPLFF